MRQSAPYWPTRLVILCRILSNLHQDASSNEEVKEEVEEVMGEVVEGSLQLLEEVHTMQNLQQLCGALRGRGERVRVPPCVLTVLYALCLFISFDLNV